MKSIFLWLALAPLIFPLIVHLSWKIFKDGSFKAAVGVSLMVAILFSVFTMGLGLFNVQIFNKETSLYFFYGSVPIEYCLLNFSLCFASISVYRLLIIKFPNNDLQRYSLAISNLLLGLCVAFLFFGYPKYYTLFVFALLLLVLFLIEYVGVLRFMYKAYRAFVFMLLPFGIIYGVLFSEALMSIANKEIIGMNVWVVPIESFVLFLSMLLISIYLFEHYTRKKLA